MSAVIEPQPSVVATPSQVIALAESTGELKTSASTTLAPSESSANLVPQNSVVVPKKEEPKGPCLMFVPSAEWYSDSIAGEVILKIATTAMEGLSMAINQLPKIGIDIRGEFSRVPLTERPPGERFIVELLLIGSDYVANEKGVTTHSSLYDFRIVVDVNHPLDTAIDVAKLLLDNFILRNYTYVSTRIPLDASTEETIMDVHTPTPVGFLEAVRAGVAPDGGLYMPRFIPEFTRAEVGYLCSFPGDGKYAKMRYHRTAQFVTDKLIGIPERYTFDIEPIRAKCKAKFDEAKAKVEAKLNEGKAKMLELKDKAENKGDKKARKELEKLKEEVEKIRKKAEKEMEKVKKEVEKEIKKIRDMIPDKVFEVLRRMIRMFMYPIPPRYGALPTPAPTVIGRCLEMAYAPEVFGKREDQNALSMSAPLFIKDDKSSQKKATDMRAVVENHKDIRVAEMYHGPTASAKDYVHQLFPTFFRLAVAGEKVDEDEGYLFLVASSGDTGEAAINGMLKNGPKNSKVLVLYPEKTISAAQKCHMMALHDNKRVFCIGVDGDFDFCQSTVKRMLADKSLHEKLDYFGTRLVTANSLNWGSLLPQIIHFCQAYVDCVTTGKAKRRCRDPIKLDEDLLKAKGQKNAPAPKLPAECDVVVPSGNLSNLVAGVVAKQMGIPIRRFVVASNENDPIVNFFKTGVYDLTKNAAAKPTLSPTMDIVRLGNLERLLYLIYDKNTNKVREHMEQLDSQKKFTLDKDVFEKAVKPLFWAAKCSEKKCKDAIFNIFVASRKRRILDPESAVAVAVLDEYLQFQSREGAKKCPRVPIVLFNTSHWAKFPEATIQGLRLKLFTHKKAKMVTPPGHEPPSGCLCFGSAPKTKSIEPPHMIVKRQYITIQDEKKGAPKAQPIPQFLQDAIKDAPTIPPRVLAGATYEALVEEIVTVGKISYDAPAAVEDLLRPVAIGAAVETVSIAEGDGGLGGSSAKDDDDDAKDDDKDE